MFIQKYFLNDYSNLNYASVVDDKLSFNCRRLNIRNNTIRKRILLFQSTLGCVVLISQHLNLYFLNGISNPIFYINTSIEQYKKKKKRTINYHLSTVYLGTIIIHLPNIPKKKKTLYITIKSPKIFIIILFVKQIF